MPSRRLNLGSEAHVKTCGSLVLGSLWPMYIYHYLSWFIHNCGCNGSPWCSHIISNVTEFILWVVIWGWLTQKGECSPWGSSYSTKAVFWDLLALWLLDSIFNFLVTATLVQRSKSQSHLVLSVVNSGTIVRTASSLFWLALSAIFHCVPVQARSNTVKRCLKGFCQHSAKPVSVCRMHSFFFDVHEPLSCPLHRYHLPHFRSLTCQEL